MDMLSLLKFWQNAGVGDFDITDADDDEGSFFDLVFTDSPTSHVNVPISIISHDHSKSNDKHKMTYSSSPQPHTTTTTLVFFNNKRKILPLDSSSSSSSSNNNNNTKSSSSSSTPCRSPFRVLIGGFQKPDKKKKKKNMDIINEEVTTTISSLLKRDHHSHKDDQNNEMPGSKRFSNRYLNLIIKPLLVSSRKKTSTSVFKHLGKSRSSSLSSSSAVFKPPVASRRSADDSSALQQQADGIQSAILHCKKSYNSPSPQGCGVVLSRCGSAPSQGARLSLDQHLKRSSI